MSSIAESGHRLTRQGRPPARLSSSTIAASSVSRALGIVGDRWALRILGGSFAGVRRFEEFQAWSGAARSTLTSRLKCLVDSGVLERVPYSDTPPRSEYRLSQQGAELYSVSLLSRAWERTWVPSCVGTAIDPLHEACGHPMKPQLTCRDCGGRVTLHNTEYEIVGAGARSRLPKPLFRRLSSVTAANRDDTANAFAHLTDIIGDRWTLLVLAAGFLGLHRFDAMQSALCIATNILTHRLNRLVEFGLFRRRLYSQHPPRCEYRLTPKGRDLFPVAVMLLLWGDRWLAPRCGGNLRLFHKECGQRLQAVVTCGHCAAMLEGPGEVALLAAARSTRNR
jgi:DNA-binding HxlR family transcriptional regulator